MEYFTDKFMTGSTMLKKLYNSFWGSQSIPILDDYVPVVMLFTFSVCALCIPLGMFAKDIQSPLRKTIFACGVLGITTTVYVIFDLFRNTGDSIFRDLLTFGVICVVICPFWIGSCIGAEAQKKHIKSN